MFKMFKISQGPVFILFFLLLSGCGNLLDSVQDDARFVPIKKQFVKDAKFFGVKPNLDNIKIAFGDTDKDLKFAGFITVSKGDRSHPDGYCMILKSENEILKPFQQMALGKKYNLKVIVISDKYKKAPLDFLETLVYHELGHCALGYEHRADSLMASEVTYMGIDRYFWLKEFFTKAPLEENIEIKKTDYLGQNISPFYEVNYSAFDQTLRQELYLDPQSGQVLSIDNIF